MAKLRLGRRIAAGLTPSQAATAESLPEAEVAALVADPGFAALVDECRALDALPEEEARRKLVALARFLLVEALGVGDMRAVVFVLREEDRDRDPARSLADGVLATHRRAAAAPPTPPTPAAEPTPAAPRTVRPAADPADRMASRAAAGLRAELRREMAVMHRATAAVEDAPEPPVAVVPPIPARPAPAPVPPAASSGRKPRNRHERRRLAALRRREGGGVTPPGRPRPPPAPRARAP